MGVSDDLGLLVIRLSEHYLEHYDDDLPRKERLEIEQYFNTLDTLVAHRLQQDRFDQELPAFQTIARELAPHALEDFDDRHDHGRLLAYFASLGIILSSAAFLYLLTTRGYDRLTGGSFLSATGFALTSWYLQHRNNQLANRYSPVEQYETLLANASPDNWREAFAHYHRMIRDMVAEFNDDLQPHAHQKI